MRPSCGASGCHHWSSQRYAWLILNLHAVFVDTVVVTMVVAVVVVTMVVVVVVVLWGEGVGK